MILLASSRSKKTAFIFPTPPRHFFARKGIFFFPFSPPMLLLDMEVVLNIVRRFYIKSFGIVWFFFLCLVDLFFTLNLSHAVSTASSVLVLGGPRGPSRRQSTSRARWRKTQSGGDGASLQLTALMDLNGSVQHDTTPFICILLLTGVWQPLNIVTENWPHSLKFMQIC